MPYFTLVTGFSSKLVFNLAEHTHIIIVNRPPTLPEWDLNPRPPSLEASALLIELMRPDMCNSGPLDDIETIKESFQQGCSDIRQAE